MAHTLEERLHELNEENVAVMATSSELSASKSAIELKNSEYSTLAADSISETETVKVLGRELINLTEDLVSWIQVKNQEAADMAARLGTIKTIMER